MEEFFGYFINTFPPDLDCLELTFIPSSKRQGNRWRNQRLSAHFVADYFAKFLPDRDNNSENKQRIKETRGALSYVANELLDNAMKFNLETSQHKVKFGIHFWENSEPIAVMFATNSLKRQEAEEFKVFIQKLLASNPEDFYISQVEASAEDENADISGLGFVTMINDYHVKLGWKFESTDSNPEVVSVTTMAQLTM